MSEQVPVYGELVEFEGFDRGKVYYRGLKAAQIADVVRGMDVNADGARDWMTHWKKLPKAPEQAQKRARLAARYALALLHEFDWADNPQG